MPEHIYIIHPSEIISQGLREACRSFKDMDISILQEEDITLKKLTQNKNIRILMIDASLPMARKILNLANKSNSFRTIGIYYPQDWPNRTGSFDLEVNISMRIETIQELIGELIDNQPGTSQKESIGDQLTDREQEVMKLLVLGHSHKEIGEKLNISIHTVISHRKNITLKLGIRSVSGLAVYAIISGFIDTDKINPESLI